MSPAQFGPINIAPFDRVKLYALVISRVGIPSVIQTIRLIPASAASIIASVAKRAGTKIIDVLACVLSTASETVLNIGTPDIFVPHLPGLVPPTSIVPYSSIFCA